MKKIFTVAAAALLVTSATFAHQGKTCGKGKNCCKKETAAKKATDSKVAKTTVSVSAKKA